MPRPPIFADPKTDFVFQRIFGEPAHKHILCALINDLLGLEGDDRVVAVQHIPPQQKLAVPEMKLSIVDVKATDARGRHFVVEMQVLNVEGFEKRVVYNVAKAYTMQLRTAEHYPQLADVVGITICDFELWPEGSTDAPVPMCSLWRMREHSSGAHGLPQLTFAFLELSKYRAGDRPQTMVDKWAYFFREAENFEVIPPALAQEPFSDAFDVTRLANFSAEEWVAYDRAKMAEQDARGALSLAAAQSEARGRQVGEAIGEARGRQVGEAIGEARGRQVGEAIGEARGLRAAVIDLCELLDIELDASRRTHLDSLDAAGLKSLRATIKRDRRWP